ncbi:MAG TPA: hypothetical protein VFP56_07595 [Candidatus Limnocylindrales bacterium]|nr:hypothetical protein [Candidatus Limnocylindrales bacterium]
MTDRPLLDQLPASLPEDLRAFLDCRADRATIANGPVEWIEIPPNVRGMLGGASRPELTITPGPAPATAFLTVKAGWVSAKLPAMVRGGKLAIDTSKLPFLAPASIKHEIQRFVDELNARLAANGKVLGDPTFGPEGMTLTKVAAAPPA